MSDEGLTRAFEPFYSTKPPGTRKGLGLAAVWGMAAHYHGHVSLSSESEEGTHARLFLPWLPGEAGDRTGSPRSAGSLAPEVEGLP